MVLATIAGRAEALIPKQMCLCPSVASSLISKGLLHL